MKFKAGDKVQFRNVAKWARTPLKVKRCDSNIVRTVEYQWPNGKIGVAYSEDLELVDVSRNQKKLKKLLKVK